MEEIKSKEIEKFESKMNDHDEAGGGDQMQKNGGKKNDQKTTLRTPADIYEHPSFYSFILDMPGLDAQNIKVIIILARKLLL